VNSASKAEARTVIGDRNYLMIGSHVGHDCTLGNDITMANGSALGGFVDVEDRATIGGFAAVHQNVRVGRLSMLGAKSKAVMDVPPFSMCDGYPAKFHGINSIGLRRAGFTSEQSLLIRKALKTLFASGLSLPNAVDRVRDEFAGNADVDHILSFISLSRRGVSRLGSEE
jgi:UDP-N-acetylglucosamine acyltransferase